MLTEDNVSHSRGKEERMTETRKDADVALCGRKTINHSGDLDCTRSQTNRIRRITRLIKIVFHGTHEIAADEKAISLSGLFEV